MIRRLRTRHRVMATALALVVPALYLLAVAARRPAPPVHPLFTMGGVPAGPHLVLLADHHIGGQLLAEPYDSTPAALRVTPARDPAIPDLLAYWAPEGATDSLPADAVLLGALRGSREQILPLPPAARGAGGRVVLYSMGWHRVLGATALGGTP